MSSRPSSPATTKSPSHSTARAIANCRPSSPSSWCCPNIGGKERFGGHKRDITATTQEIPLGSGPYRIKEFFAGRSLTLERVTDYWGERSRSMSARIISTIFATSIFATKPSRWRRSRVIRSTGIRERSAKPGRPPTISPRCATVGSSRKNSRSPISGRMQGFVFNLRRPLFADVRLRQAFNYAYDFEEVNRQLSFGEYQRKKNISTAPNSPRRGCRKGRNCKFSKPCATRFRRNFHQALRKSGRRKCGGCARNNLRKPRGC